MSAARSPHLFPSEHEPGVVSPLPFREGGQGVRASFGAHHLAGWLASGQDPAYDPAHAGESPAFSTVTMDSRRQGSPPMRPGGLFVAIRGETRDGHDFTGDALANGAVAALVASIPAPLRDAVDSGAVRVLDFREATGSGPSPEVDWHHLAGRPILFLVDDPQRALQQVAAWWRRHQRARVIAITGSVGKTTTKDLIAAVLEQRYTVLRTEGTFNNELGLPIMLLRLTSAYDLAVLEVGISDIGEMATFAGIAGPDVAVVTRVAPAHLHRLYDIDTVEREKGDLVAALRPGGLAILNADDPRVARMATRLEARTDARTSTYGESSRSDVRGTDIKSQGLSGISFQLQHAGYQATATVPLVGRHFVSAALAAAVVGFAEGCSWAEVLAGLAQPVPSQRLRPVPLADDAWLLDDSYNASPAACLAALDVLAQAPGDHLAVLGDMLELGDYAPVAHWEVGAYVPGRADTLVTLGKLARHIAAAARAGGMAPDQVVECGTIYAAIAAIAARRTPGMTVLVKGSRGMRMDGIVRVLAGGSAVIGGH